MVNRFIDLFNFSEKYFLFILFVFFYSKKFYNYHNKKIKSKIKNK